MTLEQQGPVRFSVRGMLLAVTAVCALLGLLQWLLPEDISVWSRAWTSVLVLGLAAYAVWIYRRSKQPWRPPSDLVSVSIDAKWKRRVKSPYIMGPVAALTGLSVSFAPLFLFHARTDRRTRSLGMGRRGGEFFDDLSRAGVLYVVGVGGDSDAIAR